MCHPAVKSSSPKKHSFGIDPVSFYGHSALGDLADAGKTILQPESHREFCSLFAPSVIWRTFPKQQQALDFVSANNCDLFPFAYQTENGDRRFLAAHPITFWFVDEQRPPTDRHTYEIIREFKPCKLYFDLEFDRNVNVDRNGHRMVRTFVNVVCAALKNKFDLICDEKDVLNLDSTSPNKFSCHLIFPNVIFENNYSAGYFVKQLCSEVKDGSSDLEGMAGNDSLENLFVNTDKGQRVLFCDQGVYTKNRHFRLYKSSKQGKHVALRLSDFNRFPVEQESREKFIFLSSLITYCDAERVLKFEPDPASISKIISKIRLANNAVLPSPYSDIDNCIDYLVSPGRIYKSTFFAETNTVVYDIIGNRFCHNIGRQHKSNNVMYVVDVNTLTYYQKCYDPECSNFKSQKKRLPVSEDIFLKYNIDDELVLAAAERCEMDMSVSKPSFSGAAHPSTSGCGETASKDDDIDWENKSLVEVTELCELSFLTDEWEEPH